MTKRLAVPVPPALRARLREAAARLGHPSAEALAATLVEEGVRAYGPGGGDRLDELVEEYGYASREELVEHLLERGLRRLEPPETDPERIAARLRGLGYLD